MPTIQFLFTPIVVAGASWMPLGARAGCGGRFWASDLWRESCDGSCRMLAVTASAPLGVGGESRGAGAVEPRRTEHRPPVEMLRTWRISRTSRGSPLSRPRLVRFISQTDPARGASQIQRLLTHVNDNVMVRMLENIVRQDVNVLVGDEAARRGHQRPSRSWADTLRTSSPPQFNR